METDREVVISYTTRKDAAQVDPAVRRSMTNAAYSRVRENAQSTWNRSIARMDRAWARRNARHWSSRTAGGGMRRLRRILRIVPAPIRCPRRRSSPWMRTTPQVRFWLASRTISSANSLSSGGRPGDRGWVHFLVTIRRCQRSSVPGVTTRYRRRSLGSIRDSAASRARSVQSSRGSGFTRRIGSSAITLLSHGLTVASASTDLAVLIGLGVGVDYGLFIVSRHRAAVRAGRSYEDAVAEAVTTSGRTVLFAGLTVCLALLGQFALGVSFLDGLSAAAAVTVALTIATALTLLPALLGFLGPKVLSRRERAALTGNGPARENPRGAGSRWASMVERHSLVTALASLAVIALIALPVAGLRLGTSDASTDPAGWTTHQSYAVLAGGFGPGFNGPLELAGQVSSPGDQAAFSRLLATAARTPGVASVTAPQVSPDRHAVLATLYPATAPQDQRTITLVATLRDSLIPQAEHGSSLV